MKQIFILLLTISLFSCDKDEVLKPVEPTYDFTKAVADMNVAYGSDKANVMDVYLPANRSTNTTKVILLVHGGAWAVGDKNGSEDDPYIKILLDSVKKRYPDWAIFNMNYRLASGNPLTGANPKNIFPTQEQDVATAVKYIYDNRQAFGISDKWVFMGMSAGAHLVMLQAYKRENGAPIRPKVVVDFYGPTDMAGLYNFYNSEGDVIERNGIRMLLGNSTPSSNPEIYSLNSPINFVTGQAPPTLILHGGNDDTVPEGQSLALRDKLKDLAVKVEFVAGLKEQTHGWSSPDSWATSMKSIGDFLTVNVP